MEYKKIDLDTYYRKGVFTHFSKDCKCSVSITNHIDVTELYEYSKKTNTKHSRSLKAQTPKKLTKDYSGVI